MRTPRKKMIVHRSIQGALVLRMFVQWVAFVAALASVLVLLQLLLDPLPDTESWRRQAKTSLFALGIVSLGLLPVFVWDIIKFSHRFVGPIIHLQAHVQQLTSASNSRLLFRSDDYWKDLAEDFNEMTDRLKDQPMEREELTVVGSDEH